MMEFNQLIDKKIIRLFLVVWAPYGEKKIEDIDVSIAFVFENDSSKMYNLTTDKNDIFTPIILESNLPQKLYSFDIYNERMTKWMNCELEDIDFEYYEITNESLFRNIVNQTINDVKLLTINGEDLFGIKIIFKDDFILSNSSADANIVSTKEFNQNDTLKYFNYLGEIIELDLYSESNI